MRFRNKFALAVLSMSCLFGCANTVNEPIDEEVEDVLDEDVITLYGKEYKTDKLIKTYLLMGTDHSGNEDSKDDYKGSMSDFISLLVVNQTDKTYSLIQLNRDTMTTVYEMSADSIKVYDNVQLCVAHAYGNNKEASNTIASDTVKSLLGDIQIDGYYTLPMDSIGTINHAVGGVEITVEGDLTNADSKLKDGATLTLTDEQAHIYCSRRMDVDDGQNTSRMNRQRQYLNALSKQVFMKVKEDSSFVNQLMNDLSDVSSTNMNNNTISKLVNIGASYENQGIFTFDGTFKVGKALDDGIDHKEFYLDEQSVVDIMTTVYGLKEIK